MPVSTKYVPLPKAASHLQVHSSLNVILLINNTVNLTITSNCAPNKVVTCLLIARYDTCSILTNGTRYAHTTTTIIDKVQMSRIKAEEVKIISLGEPLDLRKLHRNILKTEWDVANEAQRRHHTWQLSSSWLLAHSHWQSPLRMLNYICSIRTIFAIGNYNPIWIVFKYGAVITY